MTSVPRQPAMRVLLVSWDCLSWAGPAPRLCGRFAPDQIALESHQWSAVYQYIVMVCILQVALGIGSMLYRGRYNTASFDESYGLATTVAIVAAIAGLISLVPGPEFPRALAILTPPVALLSMAAGRWAFRVITTPRGSPENAEKILIYSVLEMPVAS